MPSNHIKYCSAARKSLGERARERSTWEPEPERAKETARERPQEREGAKENQRDREKQNERDKIGGIEREGQNERDKTGGTE